jgi:hypothetical protein
VKLTLLWPAAQSLLSSLAQLHPGLTWSVCQPIIHSLARSTCAVKKTETTTVVTTPASSSSSSARRPSVSRPGSRRRPSTTATTAATTATVAFVNPMEVAENAYLWPDEEPLSVPTYDTESSFESKDVVSPTNETTALVSRFQQWCRNTARATDDLTYQATLWGTLSTVGVAPLCERHGNELVALFLSFLREEHDLLHPPVERNKEQAAAFRLTLIRGASKSVKSKLLQYLKLFAIALHNPIHLTEQVTLQDILFRLLLKSDEAIQDYALECLSKWPLPHIRAYKERLKRLINESTFREEMTLFDLEERAGVIAKEHRAQFTPIVIRLMYPKLMKRKTTKAKTTLAGRRSAILSFFGGLTSHELSHLFGILLLPFRHIIDTATSGSTTVVKERDWNVTPWTPSTTSWSLEAALNGRYDIEVSTQKQLGFLKVLGFMLGQLRVLSASYLPQLATVLLHLLIRANIRLEQLHDKVTAHRAQMALERKAAGDAAAEGEDDTKVGEDDEAESDSDKDEDETDNKQRRRSVNASKPPKKNSSKKGGEQKSASKKGSKGGSKKGSKKSGDSDDEDHEDDQDRLAAEAAREEEVKRIASARKAVRVSDEAMDEIRQYRELRSIRQLCFTRFASLLSLYPQFFTATSIPPPVVATKSTTGGVATPKKESKLAPKSSAKKGSTVESTSNAVVTTSSDTDSLLNVVYPMRPWLDIFLRHAASSLSLLSKEGSQQRGGLLDAMVSISQHRDLIWVFFEALPNSGSPVKGATAEAYAQLLPSLLSLLSAKNAAKPVVNAILDILENFLTVHEQDSSIRETRRRRAERQVAIARGEQLPLDDPASLAAVPLEGKAGKRARRRERQKRKGSLLFGDESDDDEPTSATEEKKSSEPIDDAPADQGWIEKIDALWKLHVPSLLRHMHSLLQQRVATVPGGRLGAAANAKKTVGPMMAGKVNATKTTAAQGFPKRELSIVSRLTSYATEPAVARQLVDLLLPFLKSGGPSDKPLSGGRVLSISGTARGERGFFTREHAKAAILTIIRDMVPLLTDADTLVSTLSRQFYLLRAPLCRTILCAIFERMASRGVGVLNSKEIGGGTERGSVVWLLSELHSMVVGRLDEADFLRRADAYRAFVTSLTASGLPGGGNASEAICQSASWSAAQLTPVVFTIMHQLYDQEMALRSSAALALRELLAHQQRMAAKEAGVTVVDPTVALVAGLGESKEDKRNGNSDESIDGKKKKSKKEKPQKSAAEVALAAVSSKLMPSPVVVTILYPSLKKGLRSTNEAVRREMVLVLWQLTRLYPGYFSALVPLVDSNPDLDFLQNVAHIQLHRRRRALTRLASLVERNTLTSAVLTHIVLPLVAHFIYESPAARSGGGGGGDMVEIDDEGESHKVKDFTALKSNSGSKAGSEHVLLEEAIRTIGIICGALPWTAYSSTLSSYTKQIPLKPAYERVLVRVVCTIVDHFHFPLPDDGSPAITHTITADPVLAEAAVAAVTAPVLPGQVLAPIVIRLAPPTLSHDTPVGAGGAAPTAPTQGDDIDTTDDTDAKVVDDIVAPITTTSVGGAGAGVKVLSPEEKALRDAKLASKIRHTIGNRFIPQLHSYLFPRHVDAGPDYDAVEDPDNKSAKPKKGAKGAKSKKTAKNGAKVETIRVVVAMALVKLLLKLPRRFFVGEFTKLIAVMCNQLGRREQVARDATRRTLVSIMECVGPQYFFFVTTELVRSLRRGYQQHVRGAVVHALLSAMVNGKRITTGGLDHCLPLLVNDVIMPELVGDVAQEKEVEAIRAATKEAKGRRAPEMFQLLASIIDFKNANQLTDPLQDALLSTQSLATVGMLSDVLRRIVVGLNINPSVSTSQLLIYTHNIVQHGTTDAPTTLMAQQRRGKLSGRVLREQKRQKRKQDEAKARALAEAKARGENGIASSSSEHPDLANESSSDDEGEVEETDIQRRKREESSLPASELALRRRKTVAETFMIQQLPDGRAKRSARNNSATLVAYGLQLLLAAFRKGKLNDAAAGKDTNLLGMLAPYPSLLQKACLAQAGAGVLSAEGKKKQKNQRVATSTAVVSLALRCAAFLLRAPLPTNTDFVPQLVDFIFTTLRSLGATSELAPHCFRALAVVVRHCDFYTLSEPHLLLLLTYISQEVASLSVHKQHVAFFLLRAILSRKLMAPTLYDLIKRVSELMVQSHEPTVREQCAGVFMQFLLDYPLGDKRMKQHLDFIINNLEYSHHSGRLVVLSLLQSLIVKFPPAVIEQYAELFFAPLVIRLHNDDHSGCRARAAEVIKVLLRTMSNAPPMTQLMKMTLTWLSHTSPSLQRAGAQVLGVAIDVLGASFHANLTRFYPIVHRLLVTAVAAQTKGEVGTEETTEQPKKGSKATTSNDDVDESGDGDEKKSGGDDDWSSLAVLETEDDAEADIADELSDSEENANATSDNDDDDEKNDDEGKEEKSDKPKTVVKKEKKIPADLNEDEEDDRDLLLLDDGSSNTITKGNNGEGLDGDVSGEGGDYWKVAYLCLLALEKASKSLTKPLEQMMRDQKVTSSHHHLSFFFFCFCWVFIC